MEVISQVNFLNTQSLEPTQKILDYCYLIEKDGLVVGTIFLEDRKVMSGVIEITASICAFDAGKNRDVTFTCTDIVEAK